MTFGSSLLCVDHEDKPRLQSVTYDWTVDPLSVATYIRRVPEESNQVGPGDWAPILKRLGTPLHFTDGPPRRTAGEITKDIEGQPITESCDSRDGAFAQLLTVMQVGREGGVSESIEIDYLVGSDEYSLQLPYVYAACGINLADRPYCEP